MIRYFKLGIGAMIGVVVNTVRVIQLLWYLGVILFAAILVYDLFRIPVSVNRSWKYAPEQKLWRKMAPEEEGRLLERQKRCRHIYHFQGYPTDYCALCRKRLTKDRAFIWKL
jgi:hypothetical protein